MSKKITDGIRKSGFTNGASLIEDERVRQCGKGYGREHDDTHTDGSLLRAAIDMSIGLIANDTTGQFDDPPQWVEDFVEHAISKYRKAPIKRLVIAASLIVAEIERLQRIELARKGK